MANENGITVPLAKATPRPDLSEIGRSGLKYFSGFVLEEQLRDLQGIKAVRVYGAMRSDPIIGAMLFAITELSRAVTWKIDPPQNPDTEDLARADFVQSNFDDMSSTWGDTLSEMLTMLPYGFAFHEIVWKIRGGDVNDPTRRSKYSDGKIGLRKLPGRAPESLYRWLFDEEGGVQGFAQMPPPDYQIREIPIDKGLLFRTTAERANPEGRSVLRPAYIPWRRKTRIEELEGIGIERDLAGYPALQVLSDKGAPDLWDESNPLSKVLLAKCERIIRNIRRDEQEGLVLPQWLEFKLVSTGSRRQYDTSEIVTRLDTRIAMTVLADFLLVGHAMIGSRALVEPKRDMFGLALSGFLDRIAEVINRHLIPRLFYLNGFPTDRLCTLAHGEVIAPDLVALGAYVTALAGAGMPLFPNPALERELLDLGKLPLAGDEEVAKRGAGEAETVAAIARRMARGATA